jgi:small subunit ribosomal protein S6e
LAGGIGFNPIRDGQRRRKTVRGNTVSNDIVQINTVVTQKGEKDIKEILESEE